MMDREYMYAFDLQGKDVTVTIEKVTQGDLTALGGRKSKKPLCFFREGREKRPLALNSTNCRTIAALYGDDTSNWIGQRITLYPAETTMAGEKVACIRVRPSVPAGKPAAAAPEPSDNDGAVT